LTLDDEIEKETGKPVWQIFADESETGFRRRETGMLQKLSSGKPAVIALGGGTLLNPGNRKMAETTGQVIVLDAPLAVIHTRLKEDPNQRPLLAGELEKKLKSLLEVRSEHYISFPHRVETGKMTAEHAAMAGANPSGKVSYQGNRYDRNQCVRCGLHNLLPYLLSVKKWQHGIWPARQLSSPMIMSARCMLTLY
jgi:shikimate kinase